MADDRRLEFVLSPYFSEISSEFDKILYAEADWDYMYNETFITKTQKFRIRYGGRTPYWNGEYI